MAREIKNVAIAGVGGNVGRPTLQALLSAGFTVTVLSRKADIAVPAGVSVKQVDYADRPSLVDALHDIDAVVDTTSATDPRVPLTLIEAADDAGVYRFIPSSFGLDTEDADLMKLPVFAAKAAAIGLLKQKVAGVGTADVDLDGKKSQLTWTAVSNGGFLDWNLANGFAGVNLRQKKLKWLNDGANTIPWTTLEWTGRAAAAVLLHPAETENRVVYVCNAMKSQQELAGLGKEVLGKDGWSEERLDMEKVLAEAMGELQKGNYAFNVFADMIRYAMASPRYGAAWKKNDNELLGVKTMGDDEIKELIKECAADKNAPDFF